MNPVLRKLKLEGHDSELFSFLNDAERERLMSHRGANVLLWSFANESGGVLQSVPMWHHGAGCFAWRSRPQVIKAEGEKWSSYRGLVIYEPLCQVPALLLLRCLFSGGYRCTLDHAVWVTEPGDRSLRRLHYIRGQFGCSTDSPEWPRLRESYVQWCIEALDIVAAGDEIEF
jgi:hypothetical protein